MLEKKRLLKKPMYRNPGHQNQCCEKQSIHTATPYIIMRNKTFTAQSQNINVEEKEKNIAPKNQTEIKGNNR